MFEFLESSIDSFQELKLKNRHLNRLPGDQIWSHILACNLSDNFLSNFDFALRIPNLRILEIPSNNITSLAGIGNLIHLTWLNLSNNSIDNFSQVSYCTELKHLDLSDNRVTRLYNISNLKRLQTLLIHCNSITSIKGANDCLPISINILALAHNSINSLEDLSVLEEFPNLNQLSVQFNTCIENLPNDFKYRQLILRICPYLVVLDGVHVTDSERQRRALQTQVNENFGVQLISESRFVSITEVPSTVLDIKTGYTQRGKSILNISNKRNQCTFLTELILNQLKRLGINVSNKKLKSNQYDYAICDSKSTNTHVVHPGINYRAKSVENKVPNYNLKLIKRPASAKLALDSVENIDDLEKRDSFSMSGDNCSQNDRGTQFSDEIDQISLESSCDSRTVHSLVEAIQTLKDRQEDLQITLNEERQLRKHQTEIMETLNQQFKQFITRKNNKNRRKSFKRLSGLEIKSRGRSIYSRCHSTGNISKDFEKEAINCGLQNETSTDYYEKNNEMNHSGCVINECWESGEESSGDQTAGLVQNNDQNLLKVNNSHSNEYNEPTTPHSIEHSSVYDINELEEVRFAAIKAMDLSGSSSLSGDGIGNLSDDDEQQPKGVKISMAKDDLFVATRVTSIGN